MIREPLGSVVLLFLLGGVVGVYVKRYSLDEGCR
jgi:hypothetical protein